MLRSFTKQALFSLWRALLTEFFLGGKVCAKALASASQNFVMARRAFHFLEKKEKKKKAAL